MRHYWSHIAYSCCHWVNPPSKSKTSCSRFCPCIRVISAFSAAFPVFSVIALLLLASSSSSFSSRALRYANAAAGPRCVLSAQWKTTVSVSRSWSSRVGSASVKVEEGMCRLERMWPPIWSASRTSIIAIDVEGALASALALIIVLSLLLLMWPDWARSLWWSAVGLMRLRVEIVCKDIWRLCELEKAIWTLELKLTNFQTLPVIWGRKPLSI